MLKNKTYIFQKSVDTIISLCYTTPAMKNTDSISTVVNAMVSKGVVRVDAEAFVNELIKWVANFGETQEEAIDKLMSDMKDTHFIYHHTDVASMQCLAAHVAFLSGSTEQEIIEVIDAVGEADYACSATHDILTLCGVDGVGFSTRSKVFTSMVLTAINTAF